MGKFLDKRLYLHIQLEGSKMQVYINKGGRNVYYENFENQISGKPRRFLSYKILNMLIHLPVNKECKILFSQVFPEKLMYKHPKTI